MKATASCLTSPEQMVVDSRAYGLTHTMFFNNLHLAAHNHRLKAGILTIRPAPPLTAMNTIISKLPAVAVLLMLMVIMGLDDAALAEQRFIDHGNGTVTDRRLGLMWAKSDNQADISWSQIQTWLAKDFLDTIPQLYENWRLPTIGELQSLFVEDAKYPGYQTLCGPPVKIVPQIQLSCILVWTSDTALGLPIAFDFNLGSAFTVGLHDNKGCRVLPVRSLQR